MSNSQVKSPLGKGLSALLGPDESDASAAQAVLSLPIETLQAGKYQPRESFADEPLQNLMDSIREKGVLQPILVRPVIGLADRYEIVAGERRWRAAKEAGVNEVPVMVVDLTDEEALETAIIENVQRQDLNSLEEAQGYKRLMEEFGHSQEIIAKMIGKSRPHIANTLRLLGATPRIQGALKEGAITAGHARALLNHPKADDLLEKIIKEGASVRETENLVQRSMRDAILKTSDPSIPRAASPKNEDLILLETHLTEHLGTPVSIRLKGQKGTISISFHSFEDLDRLTSHLSGS